MVEASDTGASFGRLLAAPVVLLLALAPSLPWIWQAWRVSPLDAWGWAFLLLGGLWWFLVMDLAGPSADAGAAPSRLTRLDHAAWPALLLFAGLGVLGVALDVRAAMALAALGIGWAVAWLLLGGRLALLLLPALGLGLLALPTTGYLLQQTWVGFGGVLGASRATAGAGGVLLLKAGVALAALLVGLILAWLARGGRLPAPRPVVAAYGAALVLATGALWLALAPPAFGPPLALAGDQLRFGSWLGAEIPVTPAERRLFAANARLSKRLYSSRDGHRVSVLVVESDDVHDLHTPEYCLSGSGWQLSRDRSLRAEDGLVFGGTVPAAGALAAARGAHRLAGVYWFGSDEGSTDDIAGLRLQRRLSPDGPWRLTLVTALGDTRNAPEPALRRFVRNAPWVGDGPAP
jgi:hypothetical protein